MAKPESYDEIVTAPHDHERHGADKHEERPRVSAQFVSDEPWERLQAAIGRAVISAAALESSLQLEVARQIWEDVGDPEGTQTRRTKILALGGMTAGQLLRELRALDLPEEVERRIADAIARRNRLVHRMFDGQDAHDASAERDYDHAVKSVDQLARDCASLAGELHLFAMRRIAAAHGLTREEFITRLISRDPSLVGSPDERAALERLQEIGARFGSTSLSTLNTNPPPEGSD